MSKRRTISAVLIMAFAMLTCLPTLAGQMASVRDITANNGYKTVITKDYTVTIPENEDYEKVVIGFDDDDDSCCAELLESTSYSYEDYIVPFDREETYLEMFRYVQATNPMLDDETVRAIANELTNRIEQVENQLTANKASGLEFSKTEDGATIIPLGRIQDGKLVDAENTRYVPDSRTTIISEGWYVNPHLDTHQMWVKYVQTWHGLDMYKSSVPGFMTFSSAVSVSENIGYTNSGGITDEQASQFGLTVTSTQTVTSKIPAGYVLNVNAWTKHLLRPYIYSYDDTYTGVYRYYCHNFFENTYFYVTEDRSAVNKYDTERSIRAWTRVNSSHNPNATSPTPPTNWEW